MDVEEHLAGFARNFVVAAKRDRWLELLSRRGKSTFRNSAKLMDALDGRYCVRIDGAWDIDPARPCVYYGFSDDPAVTTFDQAVTSANYRDAIVSLEVGRLAVHTSHEGWSWLCRR